MDSDVLELLGSDEDYEYMTECLGSSDPNSTRLKYSDVLRMPDDEPPLKRARAQLRVDRFTRPNSASGQRQRQHDSTAANFSSADDANGHDGALSFESDGPALFCDDLGDDAERVDHQQGTNSESGAKWAKERVDYEKNWKSIASANVDASLASIDWIEQQRLADIETRVQHFKQTYKNAVARVQERCACNGGKWALDESKYRVVTIVCQDFVRQVEVHRMVCAGCSKVALLNPLYIGYFPATPVQQVCWGSNKWLSTLRLRQPIIATYSRSFAICTLPPLSPLPFSSPILSIFFLLTFLFIFVYSLTPYVYIHAPF